MVHGHGLHLEQQQQQQLQLHSRGAQPGSNLEELRINKQSPSLTIDD
jgi:hypothetical protein